MNNQNFPNGNNGNNKYSLLNRIYDSGKGEKFNDLLHKDVKKKEYKSFLITEDLSDVLVTLDKRHNFPNQGQKTNRETSKTKKFKETENEEKYKPNKTQNSNKEMEFTIDKNDIINNKKFDIRQNDTILEESQFFNPEKNEKKIQELASITGYKTISPLPPSRGRRENSYNPMIDRFKATTTTHGEGFEKTASKFGNTGFNNPMEPKLSKPATTIIDMEDNKYIKNDWNQAENLPTATKTHINYNTSVPMNFNKIEKWDNSEEEKNMMTVNNLLSLPNSSEAKESEENNQDQYMDNINKFIKEAFEGKDYRVNFVYYLPSNKENFYELRQANYNKISKEPVYYTLSAKGLTVYHDKIPKEFIKLSEWIIERQGYNYISKIKFFENFKIWRILKMWRKNIFKQKKIAYQNELSNTLLFNNDKYNEKICKHKAHCNRLIHLSLIDLRVGMESNTYDMFLKKQKICRTKLKKEIHDVHKVCENIFIEGIKKIFNDVQRKINIKNNESNYNNDEGNRKKNKKFNNYNKKKKEEEKDDNSQLEEHMQINEDTIVGFENYPYKYKMLVKNECKNFIKLAFLFDYILLDILRSMYIFSMKDILKKFGEYNLVENPDKLKENILDKRKEYIKAPQVKSSKNIPYFQIKCKLAKTRNINKDDKIKKYLKPFIPKVSHDDAFDPTAHLELEDLEKEKEKAEQMANMDPTELAKIDDSEREIEIEEINRAHYYFCEYEPSKENLIEGILEEIEESINDLKIEGWKGHPRFKKYLQYLEDWDDRFSDWENDTAPQLDPTIILLENDFFDRRGELIRNQVQKAYSKCTNFLTLLDPYLQLHWKQAAVKKEYFIDENLKEYDEMMRLLFYYLDKNTKTIQRFLPFDEDLGLIKLNFEDNLRKDLVLNQQNIINFLKPILPGLLKERIDKIEKWFTEMQLLAQGPVDNETVFLEKQHAKDILDNEFSNYERKLAMIDSTSALIQKLKYFVVPNEDIKAISLVNSQKYALEITARELNENLQKNKDRLKNKVLTTSIKDLFKKADKIENSLEDEKFITYDPLISKSLIPTYIEELENYEKEHKKIKKDSLIYNEFLTVVEEPEANFDKIDEIYDKLVVLKNLWIGLENSETDFDEWKKQKFHEINTKDIVEKLDTYFTIAKKALSQYREGSAITELLENVEIYRELMSVVDDFNSESLTMDDWEKILILFPALYDQGRGLEQKDYNLEFLLEIEAHKQTTKIHDIMLEAHNSKILDAKKREIINEKNSITLDIIPYAQKNDYLIVSKFDDAIQKIEECQSKVNAVLASRYARLVKDEMQKAKIQLDSSLEMIEDLKTFQKKWMYLENILSSGGDFKKKLPDSESFSKTDAEWKKLLEKFKGKLNVIKENDSTRKFVLKHTEKLDEIQHAIEEQLKSMRNVFERFFFISNDDLLYMMAKSVPTNVNALDEIKPYLGKIFDDISDLKVNPSSNFSKEITHIVSSAKEELQIKGFKFNERLEEWLGNLETQMVSKLTEKIAQGKLSFLEVDRDGNFSNTKDLEEFLGNSLSQVVATVTHIVFCDKAENAINNMNADSSSLQIFFGKIEADIKKFAKLVNKNLPSNVRRIISNMITHYVHYKDICSELNVEEPYETNDFVWLKQLRSYLVENGENSSNNLVVKVKQLKSEFDFGYEYNGPCIRLVITPLTDRVWLTMTSALNIKLGCSLGGPAGTGKTETTKDLARFLGYQCIVFNCSEQVDYKLIGNQFMGLCKHKQGAFACLDEFNRINVEVLSVIASQLLEIRLGLFQPLINPATNQMRTVYILSPVELVGKLGVFITMNPTYSGRSELPDNLKSLFRPITMMVPDFNIIAQVKLYSEGFSKSDELSKKLAKLFALATQQLSQQDHYDFTLRAVGSVLSIAGNIKKQSKSTSEDRKEEENILISALRDANFPKFIHDDMLLFKALVSDLFPGNENTEKHNVVFENELKEIIKKENYYENDFTLKKCQQIFDISNIRLGVCLTGPAGGGKSVCLNLMEKTLTALADKNTGDPRYKKVKKSIINPKAITMGELYGEENEDTKTFTFGIATKKIKKALTPEVENQGGFRWVVLDGPIDTKWIENMNSVLDDSQTLCLSNGERIKFKPHLKVYFEVEDLSQASLATVSRMGVVYLDSVDLGWKPYFHSWMLKYLEDESLLNNEMKHYLSSIFEDKVNDALNDLDDMASTIFIKPIKVQCVTSVCKFLEVYITKEHGFVGKDTPGLENPDNVSRLKKKIMSCLALAIVWGLFGSVSNKSNHKIESFIKNRFSEIKFESNQNVMEHYYDFHKNDFVKYKVPDDFKYDKEAPYFSIFIPTIDTVRYSSLLEMMIRHKTHLFITGETGAGKTANILNVIKSLVASEEYTTIQINFSARSSSENTQRTLESKLDRKKGKKILFGKGGKQLLIFIDDVNMPEPNQFGSHPPIELLRQYLDLGGFYDRPKYYWKSIEDTSMIISGGPPTGGRSKLTNRFNRHFTILNIPQQSKSVLINIYETILKGHFHAHNFKENVYKQSLETAIATVDIYEYMCETMKPIPANPHYLFNIRDISKVFQGILMIENKVEIDVFIKAWVHENQRIFGDRLTNEIDYKNFIDNLASLAKNKFKIPNLNTDDIIKNQTVLFSGIEIDGDKHKKYRYMGDQKEILKRLNYILDMYNKKNKKNMMTLVFFDYAIMHIVRISRVLMQPRGNMLLIGHGGSGKQTLCKFSSFAMNSSLKTYQTKAHYRPIDFRKDIKDFIAQAGAYRQSTLLLLNDKNVTHDFILEDINNLLNTGEIANLFDSQTEWPNISSAVADYLNSIGKPETQELIYETFVEQTREFLHIFFCTSPVGDSFTMRIRKFPSLINCSTLNWFIKWPKEALVSCCSRMYSQLTQYPDTIRDSLVKMSVRAHMDIEDLTEKYFDELSRRVYVTPKSFLDMNSLLFSLVSKKKGDIDSTIKKLTDGIKKLNKTQTDIVKVEEDLRILEPEIKKKGEEAAVASQANKIKSEEVNARETEVREKKSHATNMKVSIEGQVSRIEREKNEINAELEETWKEVKKEIGKDFVANVRASRPTVEERRLILEAAVYLLTGQKVTSANDLTVKIGQNKDKILDIREEISKGEITDKVMAGFKKYIEVDIPPMFVNLTNGDTFLEKMQNKTSSIYKALYMWGQGSLTYFELEKKLQPVKKSIDEKRADLRKLEDECAEMTEELDQLRNELSKLSAESNELDRTIESLKKQIDMNNRRKINAGKLVGLLKDEGIRWQQQLETLTENSKNFLGNIFISAMSIAYLGPFTGVYRKEQVDHWIKMSTEEFSLRVNKDYSLEGILSDPVQIRNWNISGLPSDSVSTQNGIIFFNNTKYPLLIDPQLQGNLWLKKLYKKENICVYKADPKEEQAKKQNERISLDIMKGHPILIEGMGDKFDSLFDNIVSKSYFEAGGGYNIDFNGQVIEFNPDFKIFFTTKLANPHYSPEVFLNLNIINFTVTFDGLCEQLLGEVFKKEKREKYEQRDHLIEEMGDNNTRLQEYARVILQKLADANEEEILDDEALIETLENAKVSSDIVKEKTAENQIIEKEINAIRDAYIPVSTRGSILYFVIVDLGLIDPMYQFSLEYFKKIFSQSIEKAPMSFDVNERVNILEKKITEDIYKNIKRGIFESHKTIFSFLIAIFIKKISTEINDEEWNIFLKGPPSFDKTEMTENPDKNYFSDVNWDTLLYFEKKGYYVNNFSNLISEGLNEYKEFFENLETFDDFEKMPNWDKLKDKLKTNFNKLNLIKIIKPEKVLYFIKRFIAKEIGDFFIDTSPPKIEELFEESDCFTPIIFILSQGADPTNNLIEFSTKYSIGTTEEGKNINPDMRIISLGQGQDKNAQDAILEGRQKGKWVVLANCHLYTTWMGELSSLVQHIQEDDGEIETNPNFRLWLTSMPNNNFPVSILQHSLKLTTEPPSGVKGNVKKLFDEMTDEKLKECNKKDKYPKIIYSLAVFHAIIQERKKFGPIGFNLRYDFNLADFETSSKLISVYLNEADDEFVPWSTINYLIGDINYGGRVTDDFDRKTMNKTLEKFLNEDKFFEPDFKFSKSGIYYPTHFDTVKEYSNFIDRLPIFDEPDLFGLNENANIIYQIQESDKIISNLITVMPKTKSKQISPNKIVLDSIENFNMNRPELILKRDGKHKTHDKTFAYGLPHSLTTVLFQEIEKYNRLITKIFNSLNDLKQAIEGLIGMSNECDEIFESLLLNRIPLSWQKICYSSHKPLSSWYDDLLLRIEFMRGWLMNGHPAAFWISGMFYPQGFITGVLQNYARDTGIPVSEITFNHKVMDKPLSEITRGPSAGVYIYGLFLEGATWDAEQALIVDQKQGEMHCTMPVIWLESTKELKYEDRADEDDEDIDGENENKINFYECPIFKTTKRTGIISASGRSENYVISINLPTKENKDIWTLRGTALICALNN